MNVAVCVGVAVPVAVAVGVGVAVLVGVAVNVAVGSIHKTSNKGPLLVSAALEESKQ